MRRGQSTRRQFANNLLNLTLAAPEVNRCCRDSKCAGDAAEWMLRMNQCWFAARVVAVRRKYGLTVDRREADALERALSGCSSKTMILPRPYVRGGDVFAAAGRDSSVAGTDALALRDEKGKGRFVGEEAQRHRIAPVRREHPAYPFERDSDGVVCE